MVGFYKYIGLFIIIFRMTIYEYALKFIKITQYYLSFFMIG